MEMNPFTGQPNPPSQTSTVWLFFGFMFLAFTDAYIVRFLGFQFIDAIIIIGLAIISSLGMLACAVKIKENR